MSSAVGDVGKAYLATAGRVCASQLLRHRKKKQMVEISRSITEVLVEQMRLFGRCTNHLDQSTCWGSRQDLILTNQQIESATSDSMEANGVDNFSETRQSQAFANP